MEIKAIQTQYKGYNFRSRTEARWAVFFDVLGWNWQYEAEGYNLPSGYYLPDFYMPDIDIFIEVKGKKFTAEEKLKCKELSMLPIPTMPEYMHHVFMVDGPPECRHYCGYNGGEFFDIGIFVEKTHKFYPVDYMIDFDLEDNIYGKTVRAVNAARFARFERGQQPKVNAQVKRRCLTPAEIETAYQQSEANTKQLTPEQYKKMVDEVNEYNQKRGTPTNYK